ncbi:alkaline phosphatase D family protein [Paraferrimonas haliotis]|uniref:PhoD-like phosphatase metallophosphatase domain-containing protein n=1 Tax=Paraferrimonas haliotis TaxID=2013866 RepID=A0AA37TJ46_9GAMM|nr:alkaline phosphatase D family protein [Paraferrimonas haliotis]GLS82447.1 hypothetical protein GCM10007894_04240 [Paraferrimonas haliotis]
MSKQPRLTRRNAIKLGLAGALTSSIGCQSTKDDSKHQNSAQKTLSSNWGNSKDRIWIGAEYWANPMEDWQLQDGKAQCLSSGGNRSLHSLTTQLRDPNSPFELSVDVEQIQTGTNDGGVGIRLGASSDIDDYRANCFIHKGIDIGLCKKQMFIGRKRVNANFPLSSTPLKLHLSGQPKQGVCLLVLTVYDATTQERLATMSHHVEAQSLTGNVALVSNFANSTDKPNIPQGCRYQFSDWLISGDAFSHQASQRFGPILWAMYTLNDSQTENGHSLRMSALTGPLNIDEPQRITLQVLQDGRWQTLAEEPLDQQAWLATFTINNWPARRDVRYRLLYNELMRDGGIEVDEFEGTIKADPKYSGRPLTLAALTCQNDYAFPYAPVANNLGILDPDMLYFSGDQLYENHGGYGVVYQPTDKSILNYLRKYYQFGWAFRESMRHAPTVVLPDDHDVFQGNLWGNGGEVMSNVAVASGRTDNAGGYIANVAMINTVHKTHTAHHPLPYDKQASLRDISVYFTDLIYGNVSFAIIADRQWKSGPELLNIKVGVSGENEPPTLINPDFDHPDLQLLGARQEQFLASWGADWRGHKLKAVLSQTVFSGISTHQPRPDRYLKYDFDCSGWPATARNRAIDIMRDSKALHICGDTHLGSLSQYGVHQQRDSNWVFCTPAIAAGWPRWWIPDSIGLPHSNRPDHNLANTGEYLDAFGNKMYVYAVANPIAATASNRYLKAQQKGSGFGVIRFNTEEKTYQIEAYRFLANLLSNDDSNQFAGWPVTIAQQGNQVNGSRS